jgi:RNA polymerase sigma-70 factor (ECF subfamily)
MHAVATSLEERRLLRALRAGDERAYAELHARFDARLVALAMSHGCSRAVAQEVVQETWTSIVRGIHTFQGRSSLKTWIFTILVNAANAQVRRERRVVPLSAANGNVVDLDRARQDAARTQPHERLIWKETLSHVHAAIGTLPPAQRDVITLRDVHGWTAEDVCGRLGISNGNQRVLLHRARTHVRRALSSYFEPSLPRKTQLEEAA